MNNVLGFYPDNLQLYKSAFRHSSVASKIKEGIKDSNERLEFLGDSVISAVVADYLFKKFPYKDEGFLIEGMDINSLRTSCAYNALAGIYTIYL